MNSANDTQIHEQRTALLLSQSLERHHARTDRMLGILLVLEWAAGILVAFVFSPLTWAGTESSVNNHVFWAIVFGGGIALFPAALAWQMPGRAVTRHAVALGQMLMCALFIHLTGGRTTTHFYIFGSLAFVAFYRDWKVLVTATLITAFDHLFRGVLYPQSIFGMTTGSLPLVVEHAAYVIFEDIILVIGIFQAVGEMRLAAGRQVVAEAAESALKVEKEAADRAARELESQHRYLTENTSRMLVEMDKFASGDLRVRMAKTEDDEMGRLIDGFNRAVDQTGKLLTQVLGTVGATIDTVEQISAASDALAGSSSIQKAEAEEARIRIRGLADEALRNDAAVRETVGAATDGGEVASRGRDVVNNSVAKMLEIGRVVTDSTATIEKLGASSDEIGRIISTINDIARQTNLLALNAAVEAARAGEKGAGFAVVAGEVRQLSLRTGEAVAQINDVIQLIQTEIGEAIRTMRSGTKVVEEGVALSNSTREALENIVAASREIASRVGSVADANARQAETNAVVVDKVETISQQAVEAAMQVESIVDTVRTLDELATELRSSTARFKVEDGDKRRPLPPPAAATHRDSLRR